jgi:hypothetical protein
MFHTEVYSRINPTKSPASGAGNVSEPRLMSQFGRMREVACAKISVNLQVKGAKFPVFVRLRSNCTNGLGQGARKVCEIRSEGCHAK